MKPFILLGTLCVFLLVGKVHAQKKELYAIVSINDQLCMPNNMPQIKLINNDKPYDFIHPVTLQVDESSLTKESVFELQFKGHIYRTARQNLAILRGGGLCFLNFNTRKRIFSLSYFDVGISGEMVEIK